MQIMNVVICESRDNIIIIIIIKSTKYVQYIIPLFVGCNMHDNIKLDFDLPQVGDPRPP